MRKLKGEFDVKSICCSNSIGTMALGGTDGLIELWNMTSMQLDTDKYKFQKD